MHGSIADDGTACADKIMAWPVPQNGAAVTVFTAGRNALTARSAASRAAPSIAAATITRRAPQRCSPIGRRGGASARNSAEQVARIPFHERAQLGRARHPPGGGEGLRQLIGGEVIERAAVDPLGVGTHRQHQHHVAQVDRLPPWRRADLDEGDVDQQQFARRGP